MPLDFVSVKQQIREVAAKAPQEAKRIAGLRAQATDLLAANAERGAELRAKVEQAAQADPWLRSAKPTDEALSASHPLPKAPAQATIIAADGSQITPSRHEAVNYFLINVGAILMEPGTSNAPVPYTESELHFLEYADQGNMRNEQLNQLRDLSERVVLVELIKNAKVKPVITLTDGPLELWGGRDRDPQQQAGFLKNLEAYLKALKEIEQTGAIAAGYEDKSFRDPVVRSLEIAMTPLNELGHVREARPLLGILDRDLFSSILAPGERSAVFELQHQFAREHYSGSLSLHFFYLNVGVENKPWLAYVEIPGWVAKNGEMLNALHASLIAQCDIPGNFRYPYALYRADEIARVSRDEKSQVTRMLLAELSAHGLSGGTASHKQALKDLPGRTRR